MNPIDALFVRLRQEKKKAFIPFVTAGDPDLPTTLDLIRDLARRGASLVEIGFPYSDPIADGSVIQASYTRALSKKLKIDDIFAAVANLAKEEPFSSGRVPMVCMVSYSLVHHRGPELFIDRAKKSGFSGAIVPDLPMEEGARLAELSQSRDFKLIQLVTPTTPRDRATQIAQLSTGFLYCVSVIGITGERAQLPADLTQHLQWLKSQTPLPLCVGFGISRPEHVTRLKPVADGVIVGSALVRHFENVGKKGNAAILAEIGEQVDGLMRALND